jgi:hemerythrin-like domain-containing protein
VEKVRKLPDRGGSSGNGKSLAGSTRQIPPPGGGLEQGPEAVNISEADYLKFIVSKLNERLIVVEKAKITAEENLIKALRENVDLRAEKLNIENLRLYRQIRINIGDKVVQTPEGGRIIRGGGDR